MLEKLYGIAEKGLDFFESPDASANRSASLALQMLLRQF